MVYLIMKENNNKKIAVICILCIYVSTILLGTLTAVVSQNSVWADTTVLSAEPSTQSSRWSVKCVVGLQFFSILVLQVIFHVFSPHCLCLLSDAGLTLVSAPHLARSFHHLFPLEAFQEIPLEEYEGER